MGVNNPTARTHEAGVNDKDQVHKADFSSMYTSPDPRAYFEALMPLDYQIPEHGTRFIDSVLAALPPHERPTTVLDVCCSYGINAALMRSTLSLTRLGEHYRSAEIADVPAEVMIARDHEFFARHTRDRGLRLLGLDASQPAIDYALRAGVLDEGWSDDLEHDEPSSRLRAGLEDVDVVVCTGGVGYVGAPTFARILSAMTIREHTRVVSYVLRSIDYAPIAAELERFGLITEAVPGEVVRQRRFSDAQEQDATVRAVRARGLDPTGLEEEGWHYAICFVSRPA